MSFIRELDLPTRQSKRSHHPADLMETSGLSRRKRLSHEEDDYPTPNDASSFVRTNGMALIATFVMAWIWYAVVIAPLAKLPVVTSTTNAMSRLDTLGLFFANTGRDYLASVPRRKFFRNVVAIPQFRAAQFWGSWKGFRQDGDPTATLKRHFYYPKGFTPKAARLPK